MSQFSLECSLCLHQALHADTIPQSTLATTNASCCRERMPFCMVRRGVDREHLIALLPADLPAQNTTYWVTKSVRHPVT